MSVATTIMIRAKRIYELVHVLTLSLPENTNYAQRVNFLLKHPPDSIIWEEINALASKYVTEFMPYAKKFAARYANAYNVDDIFSECLYGLYCAALFYDYTRGSPFYRCAYIYMRKYVTIFTTTQSRYTVEPIVEEIVDVSIQDKQFAAVYELIAQISNPKHKEIMLLTLEGFSKQEIADRLRVSLSTVSHVKTNFIRYAREKLCEM